MGEPVVLQTGPETFQVLLGGGRRLDATLAHHTRRGLGLHGVPPVQVATEIVRFLLERDGLPDDDGPLVLAALAGRHPEFVEEIRARLG
ncbi:hypothetical protein [Egicoccus halophilus]|uniref:Uncharacterized protein n=1 Tax=Egicoccus halophilus TaxID=1670830 RepID=A0A8J3AAW0_9ACTN|nr:hypothetical protein [Egicoccus halophilus]GGI09237.1 hypothetical protein GCM10011354_33080 [Egicoccus halophilus]